MTGFRTPPSPQALALIVVDAAYGFGNRRVMPAGPLRESLKRGLDRADGIVLIAVDGEPVPAPLIGIGTGRPVVPAVLTPVGGDRFAGSRVFAFAGIGRPEKFFATVPGSAPNSSARAAFPIIIPTAPQRSPRCAARPAAATPAWSTTAKDYVRLPPAARCRHRGGRGRDPLARYRGIGWAPRPGRAIGPRQWTRSGPRPALRRRGFPIGWKPGGRRWRSALSGYCRSIGLRPSARRSGGSWALISGFQSAPASICAAPFPNLPTPRSNR